MSSIFDNPDFYPTPELIADSLCQKILLTNKVVFEPSMGKGDLVDVIRCYSPKQIIGCELSEDLLQISSNKVDRVVGNDFLEVTKEEVSHIDCIIANPPFSCADQHILHMWEIAPEGCQIISLCNWETINNDFSRIRSKLKDLIRNNGYFENLGTCFSNAERKTNVEVGLIFISKPIVSEENYDMYFDMFEEEEQQNNGVMGYNKIRDIVNRYVGSLKMFGSVVRIQNEINELIAPLNRTEHGIYFKAVDSKNNPVNFETFRSELQKSAWLTVFKELDAEKYMTSSLKGFLNAFVEKQKNVPFTMSNIQKMIQMVIGTHGDRMKKVIIEVFDWITEHHSENRYSNEGWKTNSEYIVNKKFIAPYCGVGVNYHGLPEIRYQSQGNRIDDLMKAICFITGTKYNERDTIEVFFNREHVEYEKFDNECEREKGFSYLEEKRNWTDRDGNNYSYHHIYKFKEESNYRYSLYSGYDDKVIRHKLFGQWYDWGFFRVKVYKKGTIHMEFKDEAVWVKFNQIAAKAKGFQLASKFRGNYKTKSTGVEIYENN